MNNLKQMYIAGRFVDGTGDTMTVSDPATDEPIATVCTASKADRDAAMSTGMTDGMEMSYQSLDGVLAG